MSQNVVYDFAKDISESSKSQNSYFPLGRNVFYLKEQINVHFPSAQSTLRTYLSPGDLPKKNTLAD
jgi:hypothetical protein